MRYQCLVDLLQSYTSDALRATGTLPSMQVFLAGRLVTVNLNRARNTKTSWEQTAYHYDQLVCDGERRGLKLWAVQCFVDDAIPFLSLEQVELLTSFFPDVEDKLDILAALATKTLRVELTVSPVVIREAWRGSLLEKLVEREQLVVFSAWTGERGLQFRCPTEHVRNVVYISLDLIFAGRFSRLLPLQSLKMQGPQVHKRHLVGRKRPAVKLRWLDLDPRPKKVMKTRSSSTMVQN